MDTAFCANCHGPIYLYRGASGPFWRHSFTESHFCGMRDRPALTASPIEETSVLPNKEEAHA